jgi:uncharacterized membrane protein
MNELLTSIIHRPYVFAFLAAYLILGWRFLGTRRTILWLISGYAIAWLSEFSSIHNGFPYGEYHYVYENLTGELLVLGVPFFDSLSYPFLIFAGFATATFILGRRHANGSSAAVLLGAILTMLLDVIIDPAATMGDKWFLGKIHYYAHPGWYFGVPLTNFAGWFLVALTIIAFNALAWHRIPSLFRKDSEKGPDILYPAFYAGIALFNIVVTFWIGQWKLGLASSVILLILTVFVAARYFNKTSPGHL